MFITIFCKHCHSEIDCRCFFEDMERKSYYLLYRNFKKCKILMKTIKLVKSLVQYFGDFVGLHILKTMSNVFFFILPLLLSFYSMCIIPEAKLCSYSNAFRRSFSYCHDFSTNLKGITFASVSGDVSTHQAFPPLQVSTRHESKKQSSV